MAQIPKMRMGRMALLSMIHMANKSSLISPLYASNVVELWKFGKMEFQTHLRVCSTASPQICEFSIHGVFFSSAKPITAPTHLVASEFSIHEEHERCLHYLDASPKKLLGATAERQLLRRHISAILHKGIIMLLDGNGIEQLQRMCLLFSRVKTLDSYFWTAGQCIVMDEEKEKEMVSCLLEEMISKNVAFSNIIKDAYIQQDIELMREINKSYKKSSQARAKLPSGIEINVHVLTTGLGCMNVRLPHELNVYQVWHKLKNGCIALLQPSDYLMLLLNQCYLSKNIGMPLMWQHSFGHCVLKAEFPRGEKQLPASVVQAVVLMLFTDAKKLSFQDIKDSTGFEDKELRRTLQSLTCGGVGILQWNGISSLLENLGKRNMSSGRLPPPPRPKFECILCSLRYYVVRRSFGSSANVKNHYKDHNFKPGGSKARHHYSEYFCCYCGNGFEKPADRNEHTYFCAHAVWYHWDQWRIRYNH